MTTLRMLLVAGCVLGLLGCGAGLEGPEETAEAKGDGEEVTLLCDHYNIYGPGSACCTPKGGCLPGYWGQPGDECFCMKEGEAVSGKRGSNAWHVVTGPVECNHYTSFGSGAACCTPEGGCLAGNWQNPGMPCACEFDGRVVNGWHR